MIRNLKRFQNKYVSKSFVSFWLAALPFYMLKVSASAIWQRVCEFFTSNSLCKSTFKYLDF